METFVDVLKVGGRTNSLGRSDEVYNAVLEDKAKLDELYPCLFTDDAWVRMRAADCLEKICRVRPHWIESRMDQLLNDLTTSTQPSLQWHLAQIISEVRLSKTQRERSLSWLKQLISSVDVDWIVSVNAMKTLVYFYKEGYVDRSKIIPLFELQQTHKSNAVRKKATALIEDLH